MPPHGLIVFFTVCSLGISFLAAMVSMREQRRPRRLIWGLVGAVSFLIGASLAVVILNQIPDRHPIFLWIAGSLLLVGMIFWVALAISERRTEGALRTLQDRLSFAGKVVKSDWRNLDTSEFEDEDRKEASEISLLLSIGAALIAAPGIGGVLFAAIMMNIRGSDKSAFISNAVGFFTLLVATCWTVAYILTITLVSITQVIRGNGKELSLPKVAVSLGTWAGFGAAGGVFVGALVPVVVVPLVTGRWHVFGVELLDSISPTLLLDISAAGAVFGFLVGEVISLVDIASGEENLYLKVVIPPLVFAVLTSGLGLLGLSPGSLSKTLAHEYQATLGENGTLLDDPFAHAFGTGLDTQEGWAAAVTGMEQNGWNTLIDQHVYYAATWIVAILVIVFSLTLQVRSREVELLSEMTAEAPK